MKSYFCLIGFLMLITIDLRSQTPVEIFTPKIGDTLPEYIFTDIRNYGKDSLHSNELRGKWAIIDFWSKDCSSCIISIPKMNALHEKFSNNVNILMVGLVGKYKFPSGKIIEREEATKKLYSRLEELHDLTLTVAFDSTLENSYGLGGLPYILIVDPAGYVRAITTSVNESIISAFLGGDEPRLKRAYTGYELKTFEEGYRTDSGGSFQNINSTNENLDNHLLKSELCVYDREKMPSIYLVELNNDSFPRTKEMLGSGVLKVSNVPISSLFYIAFFGITGWGSSDQTYYFDYSKDFVFETKDSLKFLKSNLDRYAYSLTLPDNDISIERFQRIMQKDLEVYFGLRGSYEVKLMPVNYLVIADEKKAKKLRTEGKQDRYQYNKNLPNGHQQVLNNAPMDKLCRVIGACSTQSLHQPVIDKTGIVGNIDIDLQAYLYDFNEMKKALADYGLKLEYGLKELKTIVIKDSEDF